MPAWRRIADGIEIAVRVTPRASRDAFLAGTEEHFAARLAAPPVEGAANAALAPLVAKAFGVARRNVTLIAGDTARLKRLRVEGDPRALEEVAQRLYGGAHDG
ncbi:uncharacterized protein (TIGR00251 family) [Sphingomonas kyeonggiensis]|uniref:UPF0235 protein HNP52_001326 n=1 Tax=Sphingomonas kyeonggiensis TaxID=1268553 RepID=A0A7W7K0R6_9SPHN|nr:DUF167 family protein [Sphingomonas kyeonggiensis]MBB4838275.1 uncharacterized protein (TIGR00251 family) [Sphingomonas kyeonggiensis]